MIVNERATLVLELELDAAAHIELDELIVSVCRDAERSALRVAGVRAAIVGQSTYTPAPARDALADAASDR